MNLVALGSNIWTATQPLSFYGLEVGNRMTVIRLDSGELVLISPIKLSEDDCIKLHELGTVRHIVVPNLLFHDLYVSQVQSLFPNTKLWGVDGLQQKRPDLKIDAVLNEPGNFEEDLEYIPFKGIKTALPIWTVIDINETVFFHRPSRTFIITDVAFNFDEENTFKTQIIARLLGCYKILRPSWVERLISNDKASVASSVQKILSWDFDRVVPAHGSIINTQGKEKFKSAYEWFLSKPL